MKQSIVILLIGEVAANSATTLKDAALASGLKIGASVNYPYLTTDNTYVEMHK